MRSHPNYIKALENKYSNKKYNEVFNNAKDIHLYFQYIKKWSCKIFNGEPKLSIIDQESSSGYSYSFYKYEGDIKNDFIIEENYYCFDSNIDKSEEGEKIILDIFSLKNKNPKKSFYEIFDEYREKEWEKVNNESAVQILEDDYMDKDKWDINISIPITGNYEYGQEVIEYDNFNIPDKNDVLDYDDDYTYLQQPGPFKLLNAKTGKWDNVYLEYGEVNHPWLLFKSKGFDDLHEYSVDFYKNLEKYG